MPCTVIMSGPPEGMRGGRDGRKESIAVQDGLMAQPLQYLEILRCNPWTVDLAGIPGFEGLAGVRVQVPNPAAYIVQKVLIRDQGRAVESMRKDCYYLFEVSVLFNGAYKQLSDEYVRLRSEFPASWIKRFEKNARILFADEFSEGPVSAMQIYNDLEHHPSDDVKPTVKVVATAVPMMLNRMMNQNPL